MPSAVSHAFTPPDPITMLHTLIEPLAAEARQVLAEADLLHDEAAVNAAYDRLAADITAAYGDTPLHVLCVMTGAVLPCAELLRRLRMPLTFDYLHATRYHGQTQGGDLLWKAPPPGDLEGRHVLLIDDIIDEGHTLLAIQQAILANRPASLRSAALVEKLHDRRAPGAAADFCGLQVPDRYVFGCGMDYKGWWRQLPAIYAVKGL